MAFALDAEKFQFFYHLVRSLPPHLSYAMYAVLDRHHNLRLTVDKCRQRHYLYLYLMLPHNGRLNFLTNLYKGRALLTFRQTLENIQPLVNHLLHLPKHQQQSYLEDQLL